MKLNMIITEQVKMLDDKIKSNKAQYDLDRQAAKTTALPSKDLEKYKYLTGEDLGCKPDVIQRAKFEYSPLGEAFNIVFKKDDKNKKVIKHDNDLVYSSVHNFNKYSVPSFNEISSLDSKFDAINKFYKDLLKLHYVKSQNKITKQKKITVLKNASLLYNKWIDMYRKEYEQIFENKDENWRKNHDYKNLKDFSYQVDEVDKADVTEKEDEDEADQELPPWIKVSKSRFNEIKDVITRANEGKLMTRLEGRNITLKNTEKLLEGMISGKINKKKARDMFNDIAENVNKLNKLKPTESRQKSLPVFKQLEEIFMGSKADDDVDDEVDDESDDKSDDETDMPELESKESAAQRREQEGQGLKILIPEQILSRLPISLAQLKTGNNSQKLKNEIRQLLYSLYRSKKLSKTIYNSLIDTI